VKAVHLLTLLVIVFLLAPLCGANAAGVWGVSFPLLTESKETPQPGINHRVVFLAEQGGRPTAYLRPGTYLEAPTDTYGVFSDTKLMRVETRILGIKEGDLRDIKSEVIGQNSFWYDGRGNMLANLSGLGPGTYDIATRVVTRGHSEVRIIFFRVYGTGFDVNTTKLAEFSVVSADQFIEDYYQSQFGISPREMGNLERTAVRAAYYEAYMKGQIEWYSKPLSYQLLADGIARRRQGFPPALANQPKPATPQTSGVVERENVIQTPNLNTPPASAPCAPTPEQIRQKYAGKAGIAVMAFGSNGEELSVESQLFAIGTDGQTAQFPEPLKVHGEGYWCPKSAGWIVKIRVGNAEIPLDDSTLHVLVWQGGVWHEVH
jgi:hypothetical protein